MEYCWVDSSSILHLKWMKTTVHDLLSRTEMSQCLKTASPDPSCWIPCTVNAVAVGLQESEKGSFCDVVS